MGTMDNEEKKRFLWGYRDSVRRVERLATEIGEVRAMQMDASAGRGEPGRSGWIHDLSDYAARLDRLERRLEQEQQSGKRLGARISDVISDLEDTREWRVMLYHYIAGMTWSQIADEIGYSERHVQRLHGRALAHLEI